MMAEAAPTQRSFAIATVLTSLAQVMTLLGAAVLGVLVGNEFGVGAATDGFFTANAIYAIVLFVAQSLRTTTVARLIENGEPSMARLHDYMAGTALLAVGGGVLLALIGLAGAELVTAGAQDSFRTAMLLLVAAAVLQLFSGMAAAMLAVYGDYTKPAVGFAAGAAGNVIGYLVLEGSLGVNGVAAALVVGSATSALLIGSALVRRGWRPARAPIAAARAASNRMLLGAGALIATQILMTTSVAFAGGVRPGGATIYTYAMMIIIALNAALSSPISVVFAPVVARDWDRNPATLIPLTMRAFRIGALLITPAVAAIYLLGQEPAQRILTKVSDSDLNAIFDLVPLLAISLVTTMLMMIPLVGVFALGRMAPLLKGFGAVAVAHIAVSGIVVALGGRLAALAVVTVLSSGTLAAIAIVLAMRGTLRQLAVLALKSTASLVLSGAVFYVAATLITGFDRSLASGLLAFVLGSAVYGTYIATFERDEVSELVTMLRR